MATILHIIPRYVWETAQQHDTYRGDTLDAEGFIHFSTADQVVRVANARFKGHTGLQLLVVDTDRLRAPLRYEPPYEANAAPAPSAISDELFPHLYGELNLDAVTGVVDFEPQPDGLFIVPAELRG